MNSGLKAAVMPAYLTACLLLGGASAAGYLANLLLQLPAVVLLVIALPRKQEPPLPLPAAQLGRLPLLIVIIGAIELVPLPPAIWSALPGRAPIADGYRMIGESVPWQPLSLAPALTVASLVWLLPALAMLYGIISLRYFRAAWLAWAIIGVACAGILLGTVQITSGDVLASPAYLYEITNWGVAVGFFANANHMATLLLVTLPFLMALYLSQAHTGRSRSRASGLVLVLAALGTMMVVGLLINRSLAGLGLALPVAAASLLMLLNVKGRVARWQLPAVLILAVAGLGLVMSAPFGNNLTGSGARTSDVSRFTTFSTGLKAGEAFAPFGSGIGTFREIYRRFEDPDRVTETFINHDHNDYIELFIETGVLAFIALGVFLIWWGRRVHALWMAEEPDHFARAATIATATIMAHSAVDYPLRTAAISAVFATCCALMAEPRQQAKSGGRGIAERQARHLSVD